MTSISILSGSSNFLYSKLTSKTSKTDKQQLSAEALNALTPGANSIDASGNQKVLPITDYLKTESTSLSMDRSIAAQTNVNAQLAAQQPTPSAADAKTETETIESSEAKPKTAKDEFLEYARKSPAEKMRDMVLKELGLTEADLQAMSPEQREAIGKKIAEVLKEKMKEAMQKQSTEEGAASAIDISALN